MDAFLAIAIVTSFATLVTAHVAIAAGLLARPPRARSVLSLVIAPLAPYFGIRERMWVRSVVWLVALAVYGITLMASR